MKCIDCKEKKCLQGVAKVDKPYHEIVLFAEREKKKRWMLCAIIVSVVCIISNLLWLLNSRKYEKVVETTTETYTFEGIEQNADGNNYIVGGDINGNAED